ncbi:MAG: 23S rRNA (guanosine(2251)-2'-O)-methyltransferase RlmB [Alphaproteobacteria bacterium]|nr:23S rRNA (guanosine(2251)-2'-O)-methyltransferase RlmB [Alphaproteobacteria bacterium]
MKKRKTTNRRHDAGKGRPKAARNAPAIREWIYGRHAVLAALRNPQRQSGRLVATTEAAARLQADFATTAPEIMTRAQIDALLPESAVHQGLALDAPAPSNIALEDVLSNTAETAVIVVLDQVTDPHNVGAVLRSAAAFAAVAVVVQDRTAPPSSGALAKAASGALDVVPLVRVTNLARALEQIGKADFWRIGFDGDAETTLADAPLDGRVALVLGAEGSGLRRLSLQNCDHIARIQTQGTLTTLNVSNAAAIALYETVRRNDSGT